MSSGWANTARARRSDMPDPYGRRMRPGDTDEPRGATYDAEWARLHGVAPADSVLVHGWVRATATVARPLARRGIAPTAVTLAAVAVAAAAAGASGESRGRAALTAALVLVSALLDGVDGAVAILRRRATPWGYVVASVAARLAEGAFLLAMWRGGATAGVVIGAGAALVLLEYTRARAAAAGMTDAGVVSVGERPTRVVVIVMTLVTAAVVGHVASVTTWGTVAVLAL